MLGTRRVVVDDVDAISQGPASRTSEGRESSPSGCCPARLHAGSWAMTDIIGVGTMRSWRRLGPPSAWSEAPAVLSLCPIRRNRSCKEDARKPCVSIVHATNRNRARPDRGRVGWRLSRVSIFVCTGANSAIRGARKVDHTGTECNPRIDGFASKSRRSCGTESCFRARR